MPTTDVDRFLRLSRLSLNGRRLELRSMINDVQLNRGPRLRWNRGAGPFQLVIVFL